jgi:hypothetical protein
VLAQAGSPASLGPAALPVSRSAAVRYLAESLVVDGLSYLRAPTVVTGDGSANQRHFVPGRLLVTARAGRHAEMPALFVRLGLTVERPLGGDPPIGWVVQVPEGWEAPWQAALLKQAAVQGAGLDGRMQIQQPGAAGGMVPAGPGLVSPGVIR